MLIALVPQAGVLLLLPGSPGQLSQHKQVRCTLLKQSHCLLQSRTGACVAF